MNFSLRRMLKIKLILISNLIFFSFGNISIYFEEKTNVRRYIAANYQTEGVNNTLHCAIRCSVNNECLSFFINKKTNICAFGGLIMVSFESSGDEWQYFEKRLENVALFRPVEMSTVLTLDSVHLEHFAVDGIVKRLNTAYHCVHSLAEVSPWLTVDLGQVYDIDCVNMYNRMDEFGERLHDIQVKGGLQNTSFDSTCGHFSGPGVTAQVVQIKCVNNARGRYVRVQINGQTKNNFLTLCEVEIFKR